MAFVKNETQQISFKDTFSMLSDRDKKLLEKSWAKDFAEYIFSRINEAPFAVLYSDVASRPNTPVNVIVGALIIKEFLNLTDEEVFNSLVFDIRMQYALHTTSYEEQPFNTRTLGRFRARCAVYEETTGIDLIHDCVVSLSSEIAKLMKINTEVRRMDSMMIASNIKKMSRLELLYTCVSNFVKCIHEEEGKVSAGLEHYCDSDDHNKVIYHTRSDDANTKMQNILKDAKTLLSECQGDYDNEDSYRLLVRVIKEQATMDDDGNYQLKEKNDPGMDSSILQNPSDPDATFCKKANKEHRGYKANVVEIVGENGSVVSDYQYETNNVSDSQLLKDYVKQEEEQDEDVTLITDGGYSGSKNKEAAKEKNINLVTTDLLGRDAKDLWADFTFSEDGKKLLSCANGCSPKSCSYSEDNDKCRISFPIEICRSCPHMQECNPKLLERVARIDLSAKTVERAKLQRLMKSEEFKQYGRIRNGVEAIPSILRRKFNVDRIPSRGKIRSGLFLGTKIAALNFGKLFRYLNSPPKGMENAAFA